MTSKPTIQIRVVTWYGKTTAYPVNDTAKTVAKLAGTKTLTKTALEIARDLGFEIEIITETPDVEDLS